MQTPAPRTARARALLVAVALLALSPAPSSAQFGRLMKKVGDKVIRSQEGQAAEAADQPLDEPLVARLIAGLRAADPTVATRDRVKADRVAKGNALSESQQKNEATRQAYASASATVTECRDATMHALEEARSERMDAEVKAKAMDPVYAAKMQMLAMKYAKAMAEAQQKNDAALLAKANADMQREMMGDVAAVARQDTLAADAKCGKPVALPAALAEEERLRRQLGALDDQLRVLEAQAASEGAVAAGLDRVRYAMLKERLRDVYGRMDGDSAGRYGSAEYEVVRRHKSELDGLARGL